MLKPYAIGQNATRSKSSNCISLSNGYGTVSYSMVPLNSGAGFEFYLIPNYAANNVVLKYTITSLFTTGSLFTDVAISSPVAMGISNYQVSSIVVSSVFIVLGSSNANSL